MKVTKLFSKISLTYSKLPKADVISTIRHKLKERNGMTPNSFNEIFSFTNHVLNKITSLFCFLFLAPYAYQRLLSIREL